MDLLNNILGFWSDLLCCVGDRPSIEDVAKEPESLAQQFCSATTEKKNTAIGFKSSGANESVIHQPRLGIDSLPSGLFRDLLFVKDLVRLSLTNKTIKTWCELALRDKRQAVDESARAIISCPNLELIQFTNRSTRVLNDGLLHLVLSQVHNLNTLILSELDSVTDDAFEGLSTRRRPKRMVLTRLELRNMRNITNQALIDLFPETDDDQPNSALKCLCIERCRNITEEGVVRLFNANLEHVQLKSFPFLSLETTLASLTKVALDSLRTLDVSNSKLEMGFLGGCNLFSNLERIEANYTNCRDEDFEHLSRHLVGSRSEKGEELNLDVDQTVYSKSHSQIIKRLTLNGCTNISNAAMMFLPSSLTYLNLSQTDISDDGISMLVKTCPNLEHLFVGGCYEITSLGIMAIAKSLGQLKELGFSYCYQVEDDGLEALEQYSNKLIKLSMVQCGRISILAIANLVRRNQQLKTISCTLPTREEVESIVNARCATVTEGSQVGDWLVVFRSTD